MKISSQSNSKTKYKPKSNKDLTINKLNKSTNILNNNQEKKKNFPSKKNLLKNRKLVNSVSIQ